MMQTLSQSISSFIYRFNELLGRSVAWLTGAMAVMVVVVVVLRTFFNSGSIAMQESITYMHACVFMLCLAYTAQHNEHVRVDIVYRRLSRRAQAWVDACGAIVLLLPFSVFLALVGWRFASESWDVMEHSINAGGIPAVYLLKSLMPLASILLAVRAFAEVLDRLHILMSPSPTKADPRSGDTKNIPQPKGASGG